MKIMLLLALAVVAALLCQRRETRPVTKVQKWVLVFATMVSGALAAGLALGGYV
ncbi:MAG: hypothetical protein JSW27_10585 [Phycisphaerales bacterium]|nr:MAG: hypothetical protein JSW27_10585 [Phycisphaerales bacterium]